MCCGLILGVAIAVLIFGYEGSYSIGLTLREASMWVRRSIFTARVTRVHSRPPVVPLGVNWPRRSALARESQ